LFGAILIKFNNLLIMQAIQQENKHRVPQALLYSTSKIHLWKRNACISTL